MQITQVQTSKLFLLPAAIDNEQRRFFVFSQSQVAEIIKDVTVHQIPFCPRFMVGAVQLYDTAIPVFCLEEMMGMGSAVNVNDYKQFIVVRTHAKDPDTGENLLAVVAAQSGLQFLQPGDDKTLASFEPCQVPESWDNRQLVRGAYRNQNTDFLFIDFSSLLLGADSVPKKNS